LQELIYRRQDGVIGIAVAGLVAAAVEEGIAEVGRIVVEVIAVAEVADIVVEVIAVVEPGDTVGGVVENIAGAAEAAEGTAGAAAAERTAEDTGGIVVVDIAAEGTAAVGGDIGAWEALDIGSRDPKRSPGDLGEDWAGGRQPGWCS
jgi:hypothetical protein